MPVTEDCADHAGIDVVADSAFSLRSAFVMTVTLCMSTCYDCDKVRDLNTGLLLKLVVEADNAFVPENMTSD